jgi:PST family polysaccharide transporter
VWAPLAAAVWSVLAGMVLAKFVPRLTIARLSVAKFARFGANLTLKNVFVYLSRNIDNLIVARMLGAAATGIYSRGYNLTRMPQVRLVMIIYQVCFPAFCRVRYEPDKFRDVYRKASIIVAVVTSPLLLGLCALAPDFVLALLGPQWVAMSPVLRVLSIAALISCLHALSGAAIEATGKVGYEVMSQMVYAALIVVGTLVGSRYGLVAVAWAIVGASVSLYALKVYTMRLATGLSYRDFIGTAIPSVLAATFMLVALTAMLHVLGDPSGLLPTDAHWQRLLVGTAVGAILYGATLWLLCAAHVQLLLRQLQLLWSARRLPWRREADANSSA